MGNYIGHNLSHGVFTKQKIILQRLPSGEFQDTYTLDHRVANESSVIVVVDRMILQPVVDYVIIKDQASLSGSLIQQIKLNVDLEAIEDVDGILNNVQLHVLYLGKELLTTTLPSIDSIHDVAITSPLNGQLLVYNNGNWTNSDVSVLADPALNQRLLNLETVTATKTYVNNKISDLIGGAPGTLDTLKELSDALGEDANFSTTILGQISVVEARVTTLEDARDPVFNISQLDDVSLTTPSSGQILKYNGTAWVNGTDNTFSGSYNDLTDTPVLSSVATTGSYNDLVDTPLLSDTALSGSYNDLIDKPFIPNSLSELSGDVVINTATQGQILKYDGTNWINDSAPITGITTINGLTEQSQTLSVGTSGIDVNIQSSSDTHTINIPDASATARGLITTSAQTISGEKTFNDTIVGSITGNSGTATKLQTSRTITLSGDGTTVVSFDGSSNAVGTLTLGDTGVVAGTYTKVTTDSKGRIISATSLNDSDIPSLDTSKLTTGQLSIARGGTGSTSQQSAIDALTQVSSATNEHVLTKDTSTGSAKWKQVAAAVFALPDGGVATPSLYFTNDTNTGLYRVSSDKIGFVANGQPALSVDGTSGVGRLAVGDISYIGSVVSRLQLIDDNNNAASGITLGTGSGAAQLYKSSANNLTSTASIDVNRTQNSSTLIRVTNQSNTSQAAAAIILGNASSQDGAYIAKLSPTSPNADPFGNANNSPNWVYVMNRTWTGGVATGTRDILRNQTTDAGDFIPSAHHSYSCGWNNMGWSIVYAATYGYSSDSRIKNSITDSNLGLDFIKKLKPRMYKMNLGGYDISMSKDDLGFEREIRTPRPGTRTHYGLIAQEVKDALGDIDSGLWELADKNDPESTQSLRLNEFLAPIIKAIQELDQKLNNIQTQIDELKNT